MKRHRLFGWNLFFTLLSSISHSAGQSCNGPLTVGELDSPQGLTLQSSKSSQIGRIEVHLNGPWIDSRKVTLTLGNNQWSNETLDQCTWIFDQGNSCLVDYNVTGLWSQLAACGWTTFQGQKTSSYNSTLSATILDVLPSGKTRSTKQVFAISITLPSSLSTSVQTVAFPGANNTIANMSVTGLTYSAPSPEYPFTHISLSFSLSAPFPWKYTFKSLQVPEENNAYLPGPYNTQGVYSSCEKLSKRQVTRSLLPFKSTALKSSTKSLSKSATKSTSRVSRPSNSVASNSVQNVKQCEVSGVVQIPLNLNNSDPNQICNIGGSYQLRFSTSCYDPVDCSEGNWNDLLINFEVASLPVCGVSEINLADKITVDYAPVSPKVAVGTPATFVTTIKAPQGLLAGARLIGYTLSETRGLSTPSLVQYQNGQPVFTDLGKKTGLSAPVNYNVTFVADKSGIETAQFNISFYATAGTKSSVIPLSSVSTGGEFGTTAQFQLFMKKIETETASGSVSGGITKRSVTAPIYLDKSAISAADLSPNQNQRLATRAATVGYVDPITQQPWNPTQQVDTFTTSSVASTSMPGWQIGVIAAVAILVLAGIGTGVTIAVKNRSSSRSSKHSTMSSSTLNSDGRPRRQDSGSSSETILEIPLESRKSEHGSDRRSEHRSDRRSEERHNHDKRDAQRSHDDRKSYDDRRSHDSRRSHDCRDERRSIQASRASMDTMTRFMPAPPIPPPDLNPTPFVPTPLPTQSNMAVVMVNGQPMVLPVITTPPPFSNMMPSMQSPTLPGTPTFPGTPSNGMFVRAPRPQPAVFDFNSPPRR